MSERIEAVRGTKDVLPADVYKWRYVERVAADTAACYGFEEVRFPTFEKTELFQRGVGDSTDVVQKEMYTFQTKGETSVTLRPEGTASVARLCIQNGLFAGLMPLKLFYSISCFRYEKPQAGRYREFHQFGVEMYGSPDPHADCETICLADRILRRMGLDDIELKINSIGCPACRAEYNAALKSYFDSHVSELCGTCTERLQRNPMRILDCKCPSCAAVASKAPKITDYLCQECREHFGHTCDTLTDLNIKYTVDPFIVRGLDYYTRTVFEFIDPRSGLTILAGGRYDGLVSQLEPKLKVPGLGFAMGLERLIMIMSDRGLSFGEHKTYDVYLAGLGERGIRLAFNLAERLRELGLGACTDLMGRSLKAQMKYADKTGALYTMVLGDSEVDSGSAELRDMRDGTLRRVDLSKVEEWFRVIS